MPPIIHWIVTTNLGIGFIALDKQDSWINFYGAIIGGGITLAGVAWTINNQNKKRREDLAIQYKPILYLEPINTSKFNNNTILVNYRISNIGRAEAINVCIESYFGGVDKMRIEHPVIGINQKENHHVYIYLKQIDYQKEFGNDSFKITYYDIFNKKYTNDYQFNIFGIDSPETIETRITRIK